MLSNPALNADSGINSDTLACGSAPSLAARFFLSVITRTLKDLVLLVRDNHEQPRATASNHGNYNIREGICIKHKDPSLVDGCHVAAYLPFGATTPVPSGRLSSTFGTVGRGCSTDRPKD